jgi:hypothetical protein
VLADEPSQTDEPAGSHLLVASPDQPLQDRGQDNPEYQRRSPKRQGTVAPR